MGFNKFYMRIILQTSIFAGGVFLFFFFLLAKKQYTTSVLFAIIAAVSLILLIYYVNKTNRVLGNFLIYLKENDPRLAFSQRTMERTFRGLHLSFQQIIDEFQQTRREKELQTIYTENIINNITTGIITFFEDDTIDFMNHAACKLLHTESLSRITDLKNNYPELHKGILSEQKSFLQRIHIGNDELDLSIKSHRIISNDGTYTIVTMHDIHKELETKEIEAWKKLIRVINHEILNSLTPITTLTTAIRRNFMQSGEIIPPEKIGEEDVKETISSIDIIEERSNGLIDFIQKYRQLTKLPQPQKAPVRVMDLLSKTTSLFSKIIHQQALDIQIHCEDNMVFSVDQKMMEQVFINLTKNALEALEDNVHGVIEFNAYQKDNTTYIEFIDNGKSIPVEDTLNVFVPFYSTKENGTGIGLSLSRQILRLHGGDLRLRTDKGIKTFIISMPYS